MNPIAVCALAAVIQGPGEVLARYELDGRPAVVTRSDVAVEIGMHLRRKDVGRDACKVLVDSALTEREATRLDLMPAEPEVRAFWGELQEQLRAAGRDPDDFAAVRNSTEAEWLHDLAVQMAQERLVRHALRLGPNESVSGDMLRLWLAEQRKKATIVTDPDLLPPGIAARIDGRDLPILDLGLLLLRTSEDAERERFVQQVVFLESIAHLARKHGIEVNQSHLDAAIAARRREAARDPRYRGLTFEQLLETQGLSISSLVQTRVFRAKVMQDLLADVLHSDESLRTELAADRDAILARIGPRRRLGVIYRRALDEPNALVPHDFAAAAESLQRVRARLDVERFDVVARIETDDPAGKETGGDTGWHHRDSKKLPEQVLDAAFAAESGALVGPIRAADGCYLVRVTEVEPELADDELIARLRRLRSDELSQKILADAKIRWGDGK